MRRSSGRATQGRIIHLGGSGDARPTRCWEPMSQTAESTAAGIYGVIVGAAVMAASHARTATAVATAVLVTLVVYWAAERYSRLVAERIHEGHPPSWREVRRQLATGWEMVTESTVPLAV